MAPSSTRVHVILSHLLGGCPNASEPWATPVSVSVRQRSQQLVSVPPLTGSRVGIHFEYEDKVKSRRMRLRWNGPIQRVLLVKKWRQKDVQSTAVKVAQWLTSQGIQVLVEEVDLPDFAALVPGVLALAVEGSQVAVDLVISLGGDGTLLHASRLFRFLQRSSEKLLPPCLVLGAGSLGFLATVAAADWQPALTTVLRGNVESLPCTLRTRLFCRLLAPGDSASDISAQPTGLLSPGQSASGISATTTASNNNNTNNNNKNNNNNSNNNNNGWYALNECAIL
ncbi:unnamed protein product, partial [Polarella glacialis]